MKPAYTFFGELSYNKHKIIEKYKVPQTDDCPICGEPRRVILDGLEISGDKTIVTETIRGDFYSPEHQETREYFVVNKNFKATLSLDKLYLGAEHVYNKSVREYEIKDPEKLKLLVKQVYQKYGNRYDRIEDG